MGFFDRLMGGPEKRAAALRMFEHDFSDESAFRTLLIDFVEMRGLQEMSGKEDPWESKRLFLLRRLDGPGWQSKRDPDDLMRELKEHPEKGNAADDMVRNHILEHRDWVDIGEMAPALETAYQRFIHARP